MAQIAHRVSDETARARALPAGIAHRDRAVHRLLVDTGRAPGASVYATVLGRPTLTVRTLMPGTLTRRPGPMPLKCSASNFFVPPSIPYVCRMLEARHLRVLRAVAATGSFSAAARG